MLSSPCRIHIPLLLSLGFACLMLVDAASIRGDQTPPQAQLRAFVARANDRYRHQPVTPQQMQVIRDAGFNVFVQRWGLSDSEQVNHTLALCEQQGMRYAPWLRASLANEHQPELQLVWSSGQVQPVHAPLSPDLWEYLEKVILDFAQHSLERPCIGVMLDFENYYPHKQANLYHLSYDLHSVRAFARAHRLDEPPADLAPSQAPAWVQQAQERTTPRQSYGAWFEAELSRRAMALREKIDRINPRFQIMGYLNEGLTGSVLVPAWGTEAAPFVVLGVDYGRPSPLLDEATALQVIDHTVHERVRHWREALGNRVRVTGGAMPGYGGAPDPEYSAKKLVRLARASDGYWVWFETNFDDADFDTWMDWYRRANDAILAQTYVLADLPRQNPEPRRDPVIRWPDRPQVAIFGDMRHALRHFLQDHVLLEVHPLEGSTLDYFQQFQLLILQNVQIPETARPALHRVLRTYVEQGGSLVLAFQTLGEHGLGNPFPELVQGLAPHAALAADASGLIRHRERHLVTRHADLRPATSPASHDAHYPFHQAFEPGPAAEVITTNHERAAVMVYGRLGQGQVLITGDHLARRQAPTGAEAALLEHLFRQLTRPATEATPH